jgi:hypothetical protein
MLMNIHDVPAEVNGCNEGRKAIKLQTVMIITITLVIWIRVTEWQTVTPLANAHSSGGKNVLPSVRLGYSQQLHSFLIYPHKEYVGTFWTRMDNMKEIK